MASNQICHRSPKDQRLMTASSVTLALPPNIRKALVH